MIRKNYHHRDLLTLLISLFVLGSCENPSSIGLDVQPGEEIASDVIDTLTMHAVTLKDDSARSNAFNQTSFGMINDPVIGTTVADLALAIGKPTTIPRIRPDAEIDSVVLVLPYGSEYFGDTTGSSFTLQVRQLAEVYTEGNYSNKTWAVSNEVLATKVLNGFAYQDSLSIRKYVDKRDTVMKVEPQLRMPLSAAFFKELFSTSVDSASIATAKGFGNHVKGLYLSVDEASMSGAGGLATFRGAADLTGIELVYRQPNGKSGEAAGIDTVRTFLPTTVSASNSFSAGIASAVRHTYTDAVNAQLADPSGNYETVYLQAPAGLRTKLSIPHIDSLKGLDIAINKAQLVLYVDEQVSGDQFGYQAPRLTLYREDIAKQGQPVPDGDTRSDGQQFSGDQRSLWSRSNGYWQAFVGEYDKEHHRYIFYITSFVQDILRGRIQSNEFYIAPASPSDRNIPYQPVMNTGGRAVIGGGSNPTYKMELNLFYTKLN